MRVRRGMAVFGLLSVLLGSFPASASDPISPGVREIAVRKLEWPGVARPTGLYDMAFRSDLFVAGVADYSGQRLQGNGPEGGVAFYGRHRGSPFLKQLSALRCRAAGEVLISRDVVVMGTQRDDSVARSRCNRDGMWLIDASEPSRPRLAKFVGFGCGATQMTLVPAGRKLYVYAPATCDETVDNSTNQGLFSEMTVVRINVRRLRQSKVVSRPVVPQGGCTDFALLAARDLGICVMADMLTLFDITDRAHPDPIEESLTLLPDAGFASVANFTWDGHYVVVGESWCGSSVPGYFRPENPYSFFVVNVEDPKQPVLVGSWSSKRAGNQACGTRGLNVLPMRDGRYVAVVGVDELGVSVVDFTDPTSPVEIEYYDPGQARRGDATHTIDPRIWAAYWHNGRIYATSDSEDDPRVRVLRVDGLGKKNVRYFRGSYNPQTQIEDFR